MFKAITGNDFYVRMLFQKDRDMSNKLTAIFLVTTGLLFASVTTPTYAVRGDIQETYQGQTIDDMVIKFMQENNIPGLSLAIVQAPYIPRVVGYGLADTDAKRLVSTNTVFNLGQITNAYTAVAIMQLVEAGKVKLTDPISQYVPNLPKSWQAITLNQLFTHSSGLPSYTEGQGFDYSQSYSPTQILDFIKTKPLQFAPGTQVAASPTDFYLLGMVVEKASGQSYEDFVTKNQFERLGLKHTFFISTLNNAKNEVNNQSKPFKHSMFKSDPNYINPTEPATGYTEVGNQLTMSKPNSETATYGNAAVIASAQDVSFWDIALAGDILIKDPKNRDFLYNGVTLSNGKKVPANAGWQFPGHPGLMYIEGNVPGFTSFLSRFTAPTELVCVTLLANRDNVHNFEILGRKIAGAYDEKLATPPTAPWIVTRQSPYSVNETMDRLADVITQQGGKVFARIDHSGEAAKVSQQLTPTQVLVIGNPSKGTGLMVANAAIAIELPLRAMAWQDSAGQVWLSFTDPVALGRAYKVEGQDPLLRQMFLGLSAAVRKATSAY